MAVVQAKGANFSEGSDVAELAFDEPVTPGNILIAALMHADPDEPTVEPPETPPHGWEIVVREQAYASALWLVVLRSSGRTTGSETGFAWQLQDTVRHAIVIAELDVGDPIAAVSGETDSTPIATSPVAAQPGGDVIGIFGQYAYGPNFSTDDEVVAHSDPNFHRVMVTRRVAASDSEVMTANNAEPNFVGWAAISFAPSGATEPDIVEGTGTLTGAGYLSGSAVSLGSGVYAMDNRAAKLTFSPALPVGGYLRLIGTASSLACWVRVVDIDGDPLGPNHIYIVDAQQPGDATLADLVAAEQAAAGSIEVRYHS